jgi:hypothetical protein
VECDALSRVVAEQHMGRDVAHLVDESDHGRDGGRVAILEWRLGRFVLGPVQRLRRLTAAPTIGLGEYLHDAALSAKLALLAGGASVGDQPVIGQQHPPAMTEHRDPSNMA